jgi:multidrug efflux pump
VAEAHERERGFFGWFNWGFNRANRGYEHALGDVTTRRGRYLLVYLAIVVAMGLLFVRVPRSFLPDEDQGFLFVQVSAPPGTASELTQRALNEGRDYFLKDEGNLVSGVFTVNGFSFGGHGQNAGLIFVRLKDWSDRPGKKNSVFSLVGRANQRFHQLRGAFVISFAPPPALELGNATGFDFELEDRGNVGHEALMKARGQLLGIASKDPRIGLIRPNGLDDEPQYRLDIDWEKASALSLSISNINDTLGAGWGSAFVNQFIDHNRVKRVFLQGDVDSRMLPQDLGRWYVRNSVGQMVPFSTFATGYWTYGSPKLERYNGTSSLEFLGGPAPGRSTGDALAAMEAAVAKLPKGLSYEWTGLSYEEVRSGSQAPALYAISLTVVFLCLAALYESWSIPVAVMLVVPLGIIGTITATLWRGLANDVFFQVGLLTTVGLSAKNAILIVEFAIENVDSGMELIPATIAAARQRLRPILMTSMAFILGVMPLAIATGAGAGGRIAIGTGVIGGMLTATFLAVFLVPVFFISVRSVFRGRRRREEPPHAPQPQPQA